MNQKFPSFEVLKNHIETILNQRKQITADYSRLPAIHPVAGVLICLVLPKIVVENKIPPLPYLHIIYEKRSDDMKNHPGQMAFPGGTIEEIDKGSVIETAKREAQEEIGIIPNNLVFISKLDEFIASSNILVHPVVAWMYEDLPLDDFREALTTLYPPRTEETVNTVVMPVTHLLNPVYYKSSPYKRDGKQVGFVRFFDTSEIKPNDNIWGLTASMTRRLLDNLFPNNLLPEEKLTN